MAAIDDAKRFLFLHPWSTTDVDNPVKLLEDLVEEIDSKGKDDDEDLPPKAERLLAFIKGLRDDLKISEAEYQLALQVAS